MEWIKRHSYLTLPAPLDAPIPPRSSGGQRGDCQTNKKALGRPPNASGEKIPIRSRWCFLYAFHHYSKGHYIAQGTGTKKMLNNAYTQNWFKRIPGTLHHSINILSEVRNDKTGRILKQGLGCGKRYFVVQLSENGIRKTYNVHTLMALAWGLDCPPGYVVDHIDNVKTNNHLDNLQVITYQENSMKANGWKVAAIARGMDRAYELTFKEVL